MLNEDFNSQLNHEEIWKECMAFFNNKVMVDKDKAIEIFKKTISQRESDDWIYERSLRITASNFGKIVKMTERRKKEKDVYQILYQTEKIMG